MKKETTILRPVKPNAGLEAVFRKRLLLFLEKMHRSISFQILRAYKSQPPEMAADELPYSFIKGIFRKLSAQWLKELDDFAERFAMSYGKKALKHSDTAMASALQNSGMSVKFTMNRAMRDVFHSSVESNVSLIKSIGEEHFGKIEQLVMRSVSEGRDLFGLAEELHKRYDISRNRAKFISFDQNNKMTSVFTRVRQKEIGCTKAVWRHSHGGHRPRATHMAFSGKEYDIEKGAYLDGEWIFPGQIYNCRCFSQAIIPRF